MLVALSASMSCQAAPTENTRKKRLKFIDYLTTHPDAIVTFSASNMVLNVYSDVSYLYEIKASNMADGLFFL